MATVSKPVKLSKGDSTRADVQSVNQPKTNHGAMAFFKRGGTMATKKMNEGFMAMIAKKKAGAKTEMPMKKGGTAKKMASGGFTRSADGIASKGKTKAKQIRMNMGGKAC
jgi:hypothetical protein